MLKKKIIKKNNHKRGDKTNRKRKYKWKMKKKEENKLFHKFKSKCEDN